LPLQKFEKQGRRVEMGPKRTLLEGYVAEHALTGRFDVQHDVERRSREVFARLHEERQSRMPSLRSIPSFHVASALQSPSRQLLRSTAHRRLLRRKTHELVLSEDDLARLAALLTENASKTEGNNSTLIDRINFEDFLDVASRLPPHVAQCCNARSFMRFPRDALGRINAHQFFHSVCQRVARCQTRLQLSM
jgi:serine/threonine-protein phosphatase 2A regulatory subunit B''